MAKVGRKNIKISLVLSVFFVIALAILIFSSVYSVWLSQKVQGVSVCGFEIAKGESLIHIQSGTVAQFAHISIGASVESGKSAALSFFDNTVEQNFYVKECEVFEYKTGTNIFSIKVSKIHSKANWWSTAAGSSNASVELIISHKLIK